MREMKANHPTLHASITTLKNNLRRSQRLRKRYKLQRSAKTRVGDVLSGSRNPQQNAPSHSRHYDGEESQSIDDDDEDVHSADSSNASESEAAESSESSESGESGSGRTNVAPDQNEIEHIAELTKLINETPIYAAQPVACKRCGTYSSRRLCDVCEQECENVGMIDEFIFGDGGGASGFDGIASGFGSGSASNFGSGSASGFGSF